MRKLLLAALPIFACLAFGAAAEPFSSKDFGFSAEFPSSPTAIPTPIAEKDGKGRPVSTAMRFIAKNENYFTGVNVDLFTDATKFEDVPKSLVHTQNTFVDGAAYKLVESHVGQVQSYPAEFFTFEAPDEIVKGHGVVVIVPAVSPRRYLITYMSTSNATPSETEALDRFLASFKIL
jgi:hypothetical protein